MVIKKIAINDSDWVTTITSIWSYFTPKTVKVGKSLYRVRLKYINILILLIVLAVYVMIWITGI